MIDVADTVGKGSKFLFVQFIWIIINALDLLDNVIALIVLSLVVLATVLLCAVGITVLFVVVAPVQVLQELVHGCPGIRFLGVDKRFDLGDHRVPRHVPCLVELERRQNVNIELRVRVQHIVSNLQS